MINDSLHFIYIFLLWFWLTHYLPQGALKPDFCVWSFDVTLSPSLCWSFNSQAAGGGKKQLQLISTLYVRNVSINFEFNMCLKFNLLNPNLAIQHGGLGDRKAEKKNTNNSYCKTNPKKAPDQCSYLIFVAATVSCSPARRSRDPVGKNRGRIASIVLQHFTKKDLTANPWVIFHCQIWDLTLMPVTDLKRTSFREAGALFDISKSCGQWWNCSLGFIFQQARLLVQFLFC